MSIFKSGSIRGKYGSQWNRDTVYRIGYSLVKLLQAQTIVVGRDGRNSSDEIYKALTEGLTRAGCSVLDIGHVDTPAVVFANITYHTDASVMITASHNPPEYNGLKISGKMGLVISKKNGLSDLENMVRNEVGSIIPGGTISALDIGPEYLKKISPFKRGIGKLNCIVDCSNGMGSVFIQSMINDLPGQYTVINDTVDGNFPAHGPNPTIESNLTQLKNEVLKNKADLGVCFDGDGDRTIFIDEKGQWISPDLILALIGLYYFKHFPKEKGDCDGVLYDVRCSNSVPEFIKTLGGHAHICSTGHTSMQKGIPSSNGIFGGELPGHYYYRDFYNLDNGWIPFLQIQALLSLEDKTFSELILEVNKYCFSGEINFDVSDGEMVLNKLKDEYSTGIQTYLDGIRVDYKNWWFLARMANTEPILRLVVEAENPDSLGIRVNELRGFITKAGGLDQIP